MELVRLTLFKKRYLPDFLIIMLPTGFSRPVIKIGKMLELSNNEKQYAINELSAWAYENYLKHKNVISTRSLVDCIIYSRILTPEVNIDEIKALFEATKDQVEYFFYIPIEFDFCR